MKNDLSLPILPPLPPTCEALFEAIEDGICVQTPDSRIVRANPGFARLLGKPLDQIIGHTCAEAFDCLGETGSVPHFCARAAIQKQTADINVPQVAGEEISGYLPGQRLRARVSAVRDDAGVITAFVMVVRDITDVVIREREQGRVEQLARFGELSAGLAHEIKNPLAGIQGAVDILIQRRSPADAEREVLEGVRREVRRIDAIVHSLLDRARPREFHFQPASLNETVLRAVNLAKYQAASISAGRGQQIKVEFLNADSPIIMTIDSAQIEDAVLNLLLNAIEAIEEHGAVTVRLTRISSEAADEAIIEVTDTGHGIHADHLPQIFSPFFTTQPNGTGLGLPAVRRIARAHGGNIEVRSTSGQGSVFTIRLPNRDVHLNLSHK